MTKQLNGMEKTHCFDLLICFCRRCDVVLPHISWLRIPDSPTADTAEMVSAVSVSASSEVPEAPEAQIVAAESAGATEGKVIAVPERFF